jgi:endoribonuclease Dicer
MRIKPEIWSQLGHDMPLELFPTILALDRPEKVGRPTRPLILLSRQRLPQLPSVPLFFGDDDTSLATPLAASDPLHLSTAQVESLRLCTLKIFQDIFSKQYEANCNEFPYFLAPEKESHAVVRDRKSATIDWDLVHEMGSIAFLDWENKPEHFYQDRFIVDPCDGSRKMILLGLNKNLKPSDPAPEDAPAPRLRYFSMCSDKSIKEYSTSLWTKQRKLKKWRDDQPVVNAEILSLRRNFLDQFFVKDKTNSKCAIILEPLQVSPVSMSSLV